MDLSTLTKSISTLLIILLIFSITTEAIDVAENESNVNLINKNLLQRNGEIEQQSSVDANTQALWEAYWKQYPENAWDATPDYYRNHKSK